MAKYRFEQIAINCKEKVKADDIDTSTYIGLEHLDPGCLHVSRWGSAVPIKGDKIVMHGTVFDKSSSMRGFSQSLRRTLI